MTPPTTGRAAGEEDFALDAVVGRVALQMVMAIYCSVKQHREVFWEEMARNIEL